MHYVFAQNIREKNIIFDKIYEYSKCFIDIDVYGIYTAIKRWDQF